MACSNSMHTVSFDSVDSVEMVVDTLNDCIKWQ
jgi:hypothetical protein